MSDIPNEPIVRHTFISTKVSPSAKSMFMGRVNSLPVSSSGRYSSSVFNDMQLAPDVLDMFPLLAVHAVPTVPDEEPPGWRVAWISEESFRESNSSKKDELCKALDGGSVSPYKTVDKFWRANGRKIYSEKYICTKKLVVLVDGKELDQLLKLLSNEKSAIRLIVAMNMQRKEHSESVTPVNSWPEAVAAIADFRARS